MGEYPKIKIDHAVEYVRVFEGETLTVYLSSVDHRNSLQVELRVTGHGQPEIFADGIDLKRFSEWQSLEPVSVHDKRRNDE